MSVPHTKFCTILQGELNLLTYSSPFCDTSRQQFKLVALFLGIPNLCFLSKTLLLDWDNQTCVIDLTYEELEESDGEVHIGNSTGLSWNFYMPIHVVEVLNYETY